MNPQHLSGLRRLIWRRHLPTGIVSAHHVALAVLALAILFASVAQAQTTLTFAGADDVSARVAARILTVAYARIGISVSTSFEPGERAIISANLGQKDGDVNRIPGVEATYPNLVRVPVALGYVESVAIVKDPDIEVHDWAGLKPYSIGIRRGMKISEQNTEGMNRQFSTTNEQLLMMLSRDRFQIAVMGKVDADAELKKLNKPELHLTKTVVDKTPLFHYLNKKYESLVPRIASVLEAMRRSGELARIRTQAESN
jgi:polar amino acid transport system substrate-binding protein